MTGILLNVEGVTLQYKTARDLVTATYKVDFAVHEADRFVILGPSGCGKSPFSRRLADSWNQWKVA